MREMQAVVTYNPTGPDEWFDIHKHQGAGVEALQLPARTTWVSPELFLRVSGQYPFGSDDPRRRRRIEPIKERLLRGLKVDPVSIWAPHRIDGRHRAQAAIELGIQQIPVLEWSADPIEWDLP